MSLPRFAVTPGEPAGIGPDLCLLLAAQAQPYPLIAIASQALLAARASQLQLGVQLIPVEPGHWPEQAAAAGSLYVWDTPLSAPVVAGQLNPANAAYVLQTLHRAGTGCAPANHHHVSAVAPLDGVGVVKLQRSSYRRDRRYFGRAAHAGCPCWSKSVRSSGMGVPFMAAIAR